MTGKIEHHIISPHRDDAVLTFGGFMLSRVAQGEPVYIHIIYGIDGYMRPDFTKELLQLKLQHPHLKKLTKIIGIEFNKKIINIFEKQKLEERDILSLGIAVRSLEEEAVSKVGGFELINYNLPCAFPLRGYSKFNSSLVKEDANKQKKLLLDQEKPSLLQNIKKRLRSNKMINLYFPAGIGGHPDHIILNRIGRWMEKSSFNVGVVYGQDMPYALVPEWYSKSEMDFSVYQKQVINITPFLKQKTELLKLYHSQLSNEDLRLSRLYPRYSFNLLNKNYSLPGMREIKTEIGGKTVEIQYKN